MFEEMGMGGFVMFCLFIGGIGIFIWKSWKNLNGTPLTGWMKGALIAGALIALAVTFGILGAIAG